MTAEHQALELYEPTHSDISLNRPPQKVLQEARDAAKSLSDVIANKKKPVIFNGEQYLEYEDWQTVGRFYGITAKVRETKFVQYDKAGGFEASADALLVSTGQIISSADAMCMNDEPNWSKKPMFQLRSMAQTRACAKSLRNVLAWVVVLAGYKPTPAEEMDGTFNGKADSSPHKEASGTPGPKCEKCGGALKFVPAGKSKTSGKDYGAFWICEKDKCSIRDSEWKKKLQETLPVSGYAQGSDPDPMLEREPGQDG